MKRAPPTFIDECVAGNCRPSDVEFWVEAWHRWGLHDYLGMTNAEYRDYMCGHRSVEQIVDARRQLTDPRPDPEKVAAFLTIMDQFSAYHNKLETLLALLNEHQDPAQALETEANIAVIDARKEHCRVEMLKMPLTGPELVAVSAELEQRIKARQGLD